MTVLQSPVFWITMFVVFAVSSVVVAQNFDENTTVQKPPERVVDPGHCFEYEMKMLYAATQVGDPNQESYLRAAEAYKLLDENGQKC